LELVKLVSLDVLGSDVLKRDLELLGGLLGDLVSLSTIQLFFFLIDSVFDNPSLSGFLGRPSHLNFPYLCNSEGKRAIIEL
jgi:hypothetical protein